MLQSPRWRKILIAVLVIAIIGVSAWWLWPKKGDQASRKPPPVVVQTAPVQTQDVPIYLDGLGTIQAANTVTVRSQVDGTLIKVSFNEGQEVKQGQVLAQIDPRTYQAQLNQAIATREKDAALLENARRDFQRYQNLGEDIAQQTVDTARSTIKQLEASVRSDEALIANQKTLLSYTTITAPISGRTGIRQVDVGNLVRSSDANGIVVLTQLQPISVIFSLPQQNLVAINQQINAQSQLPVVAMAADGQTVQDEGKLILVDNQIDQATGTIKLKAEFPNANHLLWPGGFTNVRLLLNTQENALVVPAVAVQRGPQGAYVYVLQADHTVKLTPVTVAMTQDQIAVIRAGLRGDEQVITDGMVKLQDGSKVTLPGETPMPNGNEHGGKHRRAEDNHAMQPSAAPSTDQPQSKDSNPANATSNGETSKEKAGQ